MILHKEHHINNCPLFLYGKTRTPKLKNLDSYVGIILPMPRLQSILFKENHKECADDHQAKSCEGFLGKLLIKDEI